MIVIVQIQCTSRQNNILFWSPDEVPGLNIWIPIIVLRCIGLGAIYIIVPVCIVGADYRVY